MSTKTERLELRCDSEFLAKVDEWRRHQPDLPPRATAVRQLVEIALAKLQEGKKKGRA
jgi:hypothetical protein